MVPYVCSVDEMVDAAEGALPEPAGPSGDESLPEPVRRVAAFLASAGVEARLHEFPDGTSAATATEAARAVGCVADQIVKSLIFLCDGEPTLVMVSGPWRADDAKIAEAVGASAVKIAKPAVVRDRTGFDVGGVAPFPLPQIATAICDRNLLSQDVVWASAGSVRHVVAIAPHDLVKLASARPADVSIPPA